MGIKLIYRLSFTQARQAVVVAFVLGILLSTFQIVIDFINERNNMDGTISQIALMLKGSAENASYNVDRDLAKNVVKGLLEYKPICNVNVTDEFGKMLYSRGRSIQDSPMRKLMALVFEKNKIYSFPLFHENYQKIGVLEITVDTYLMAGHFFERAWVILISGMVRNIALAIILTFSFYKNLTQPLLRIVNKLSKVGPGKNTEDILDPPPGHEKDEMALMVNSINRLITGFKESESALRESEEKYRNLSENLELEVGRVTQEVKKTHSQLLHQEKLASIGHLAAGVAHEINNPMGFITSNLKMMIDYSNDMTKAIRIYSDFLEDLKKTEPSLMQSNDSPVQLNHVQEQIEKLDLDYLLDDIPNLLNESLDGAERINKIVSDLKDFAHPGEEKPTQADLVQCIESTLNIVWNELKYKATMIKSYSKIPPIYCYPRQLNQVIMNLLVNSAQAIEKKGEIEITTRDCGDFVELSIRDTGSGIPEENISKLFDPFFTTKEVGKGTGLGLNLVYNIINKHHGTIDVKSQIGNGTTFTIKLPVNPGL